MEQLSLFDVEKNKRIINGSEKDFASEYNCINYTNSNYIWPTYTYSTRYYTTTQEVVS